jgi:peptidoglycan/xylan/chitin deacetylase (PgdA/CDA1 family)
MTGRKVIPILTYHSVSDRPWPDVARFTVTPDRFGAHLALLAELDYTALNVTQLASTLRAGAELPPRPVLITFDDGYADVLENALPRLAARGFTSTLYMITGCVRDERSSTQGPTFLSWNELRELERSGMEIGSHSHTHPQLDVLSVEEARAELQVSKHILEDKLGHEVPSLAYPYGYHGPTVRRLAIEAGYASACAVKQALSADHDDLFALSRVLVTAETGVEQLRLWLSGAGLRVAPRGERVVTIGWRWARRISAIAGRTLNTRRPAYAR